MKDDGFGQLLQPVLITYNRARHLDQTLSSFYSAGWSKCAFHVLDNASTDTTAQIVSAHQKRWPNLQYHRNTYNIGGNANILRAVEIASSEYHWVIGDDDEWLFESEDELEKVLQLGLADIVRLGWLVPDEARGIHVSAKELALRESLFFASTSMISATILRRSLVVEHLARSYQNIGNSYPQLVPIMIGTENGAIVYSLTKNFMVHTPSQEPGYFFGDLELYAAWYSSVRYLETKVLRVAFLREVTFLMTKDRNGPFNQGSWLTKVALNAKALGVSQWTFLLTMLGNAQGVRMPVIAAITAYALVPGCIARWLRTVYRKFAGLPPTQLRADRSRL